MFQVSLVEDPSLTFHTGSPLSPAILLPAPQDSSISSPLTHSCTETLEELLLHPSNIQASKLPTAIGTEGWKLSNPLLQWALPFLTSLLVIGLLLMLAPCIIRFIQDQIKRISNQTVNQLLLQDFQALNKIGPSGVTIARHLPTIIIASMMPCTPNKCSEATFSHQEKSTED
ncbi:ERV-BabFcenv provirus ancestral Env polyprotein-like isoform X2 [Marmota flaviventris]|uniref:ERV-BabFcenv provirus ancestral Env polyprotein-like isoform X2 n=1 Tax=Marmota flaviventris TaxID=93162 RepID=UPI003A84A5AF